MTNTSTTVVKNHLEEMEKPSQSTKDPKCSTWVQSQKWQNDLSSFPRQTIHYNSNPSLCFNQWCWNGMVLEDLQDLLEQTPKKDVLYIIGDWNANVGSQEIPGVIGKFGLGVQNEADQRLTEFCQENAVVMANTFFKKHKGWLYTWTSPDGQYWNQIDYILCSQRWRSSTQSAK